MTVHSHAHDTDEKKELVVIETLLPAKVFAPGGVDDILSKLKAEVLAKKTDVSTLQGRKEIAALAYKVARSKTALDDMGKNLTADLKKQTGAIDAERKRIRDELDALKDQVRKPLTDFENADNARIARHEEDLAAICQLGRRIVGLTSAEIRIILKEFLSTPRQDRQEFRQRFAEAEATALAVLEKAIVDAKASEERAAELERLRAAEQERLAAVAKAEAEREMREREERAAAKAKADAEAKAAAAIAEAKAGEERAEAARKKAESDAEAALIRAAEDLAAERRRADEEIERQRDENEARVREESAAVAKRFDDHAKIAIDKAAREADVIHRRKVNQAAAKALVDLLGIPADLAFSVIGFIDRGSVPNVSIIY